MIVRILLYLYLVGIISSCSAQKKEFIETKFSPEKDQYLVKLLSSEDVMDSLIYHGVKGISSELFSKNNDSLTVKIRLKGGFGTFREDHVLVNISSENLRETLRYRSIEGVSVKHGSIKDSSSYRTQYHRLNDKYLLTENFYKNYIDENNEEWEHVNNLLFNQANDLFYTTTKFYPFINVKGEIVELNKDSPIIELKNQSWIYFQNRWKYFDEENGIPLVYE